MADVVRSYTHAQDHDGSWDSEYPYDGDTQTHGLMYEDTTTGEWKDISSDLPYDVFYDDDYASTYYIYSANGAWVEHNTNCIFHCSGYGYGPDIAFSHPNLAPGDTTNKLTINGKEVNIQVGDCILLYNKSADEYWDIYPGNILHNFVVSKTYDDYLDCYNFTTTAWYIEPGVWSTTSGSNDPTHRIILANCAGDENGDHGYVNSFYDGPPYQRVVHWFEVEPADLSADDTRNPITVNGQTITAEYGNYFDVTVATQDCDSNLNATIDTKFPQYGGVVTYIYPGIWADCNFDPVWVAEYSYIYHETVKSHVQLKWTDPPNLTDWDPYPCTWEGTVIVRKEDSPPLHRWDGEKVVRTTTRDKYKTEPYKDEDIVSGKTYYYAFMPYYTRYEDPDHPIRYYTFTKVIKVEIGDKSLSSTINSIDVDATNATIHFTLSQPDGGSFTSIKMYGKIGKNPKCDNTDDVVEDVDSSVTSLTLTGLESGSTYYFCLVTMDTSNKKLSSNVMSCYPFDPVPEEYKSYVNKLNSTTWGASDTYTLLQYSNRRGNSNTWVLDDIYAYTTRDNFNNDSNCYDLIVLSECNIVVTSNNNSVTVNYNYTVAPHDVIKTSGRDMWGTYSQSGNHGDYIQTWGDRSGINFYGQYNVDTITFSLTTSFNSLADCMSYLTQHFRRINLKVDGYDWIKK